MFLLVAEWNGYTIESLASFDLDDELMAALATTVLSDQHVDVLLRLPRKEEPTDFRPTLRQLQLLQQFSLFVEEGEAAVFRESAELEEGGD